MAKKTTRLAKKRAREIGKTLEKNDLHQQASAGEPVVHQESNEPAANETGEAFRRFREEQEDYEANPCSLPERLPVFMACLAYHDTACEERLDAELRGKKYTPLAPGTTEEETHQIVRALHQAAAKEYCTPYGADFKDAVEWMRKDICGITEGDVKRTADEVIRRGFVIETTKDALYNSERHYDITAQGLSYARKHGLIDQDSATERCEEESQQAGVSNENDAQCSLAQSRRPKPRKHGEHANSAILVHLNRRPHDTVREVAVAVDWSTGKVAESLAWKANQLRLKTAKNEGRDPIAIPLDTAFMNKHGATLTTQSHGARDQLDEIDDKIDADGLNKRIAEHTAKHPDESPEQVAKALGCTAGDVEQRKAELERLISGQAEGHREDIVEEDPLAKHGKTQKWYEKQV